MLSGGAGELNSKVECGEILQTWSFPGIKPFEAKEMLWENAICPKGK